jgi:hypothetical protein
MSYELGFSTEFFLAPGEPYDVDVALTHKPVSVWQAIVCMKQLQPNNWKELAREVFDLEPQFLTYEMVFDMVQKTNTCSNLSEPVRVWIDGAGLFRLNVWE